MTPQELRNSVLQLAIQGKLVEQRAEEGSGEEQYLDIQKERASLVKNGTIKKEKLLPPIKEEEVLFDIPDSWKWVKFGEIVFFNIGKTPPRAEPKWWANEVPWVSIADMPNSGKVDFTKEGVSQQAINEIFKGGISPSGTLLMSFKLSIGKMAILDIDAVHNEAIISIRPLCDLENNTRSFLFYVMPLVVQNGDSKNAIKGKTLNKNSINNLILPLPPYAEQKRIVEKIEELMPLVDQYEEAWNRLEELNKRFPDALEKSILQFAIQGKLVEQFQEEGTGEDLYQRILKEKQVLLKEGKIKKKKPLPIVSEAEVPFEMPSCWRWVRLGDLFTILNGDRGKNYPSKNTLSRTGIPFISALNLNNGTVKKDENLLCLSQKQYDALNGGKLIEGDSVVCIRGSLGKHGRYPFEKGAIASSLVILRKNSVDIDLSDYLSYYLDSPLFFSEIKKYDNGTAQPNLSAKNLELFLIPLPSFDEQKRIVRNLDELLAMCEVLK